MTVNPTVKHSIISKYFEPVGFFFVSGTTETSMFSFWKILQNSILLLLIPLTLLHLVYLQSNFVINSVII